MERVTLYMFEYVTAVIGSIAIFMNGSGSERYLTCTMDLGAERRVCVISNSMT